VRTNVGSGDRGVTSLLSGERVPKSHERIEACGDLDELGSVLGAFAAAVPDTLPALRAEIQGIQGELLHIGAWMGTAPDSAAAAALTGFSDRPLQDMEAAIDRMEEELAPLASFILAGGHPAAAWAHVARTVCRRAERRVVAVSAGALPSQIIPYLNRLSTYLFVAARYCNQNSGIPDITWKG
jgi:cob(I)alamin adenosyltransferase